VLTDETGKRTTGLLVSVQVLADTDTGEYQPIPDTGIGVTLLSSSLCELCNLHELNYGKNKPRRLDTEVA